ncbi:hypothetical protein [Methanobacterium aggregans]|uniref:hypothetical protein n=1 Tax=Methanobacterium aggregans TaxID=1615586 RepID=UPI001AEAEC9B|nr:hypothetical protein [Methanobacterium aggregans]MBP2045461.1 putative membrane protein (Fun14 family) [Methanobacterium aggregans]
MGLRNLFAVIGAVIVFIGTGTIIALSAGYLDQSAGNLVIRLLGLFICFILASMVYNLIKIDAVEDKNQKKNKKIVTGKNISRKLEEKQKK